MAQLILDDTQILKKRFRGKHVGFEKIWNLRRKVARRLGSGNEKRVLSLVRLR